MLFTVFFNQSLNSTLIEALMVSTSNYEMRDSLFLGIDASFNLKFRIAFFSSQQNYAFLIDATRISYVFSLYTFRTRVATSRRFPAFKG